MARKITVTPRVLREAATKIDQYAAEYKSAFEKMYSEIDSMNSVYEGADYEAYATQVAGFKEDLNKMYTLMGEYATFLRDSATKYDGVQQNIIAQAARLTN